MKNTLLVVILLSALAACKKEPKGIQHQKDSANYPVFRDGIYVGIVNNTDDTISVRSLQVERPYNSTNTYYYEKSFMPNKLLAGHDTFRYDMTGLLTSSLGAPLPVDSNISRISYRVLDYIDGTYYYDITCEWEK